MYQLYLNKVPLTASQLRVAKKEVKFSFRKSTLNKQPEPGSGSEIKLEVAAG
jgi:hypothetical protein